MQHLDEGTIHGWLDGALAPEESRAAETHVAECRDCAAAVAEARGLIAGASRVLLALDNVPAEVLPVRNPPGATGTGQLSRGSPTFEAKGAGRRLREFRASRIRIAAAVAFLAVGAAAVIRTLPRSDEWVRRASERATAATSASQAVGDASAGLTQPSAPEALGVVPTTVPAPAPAPPSPEGAVRAARTGLTESGVGATGALKGVQQGAPSERALTEPREPRDGLRAEGFAARAPAPREGEVPAQDVELARKIATDRSPRALAPSEQRAATDRSVVRGPATIDIRGTVTDSEMRPLPQVTVFVAELGLGTVSDSLGQFTIAVPAERMARGELTLSARRLGYRSASAHLAPEGSDREQNFALQESAIQLSGLAVTGVGERDRQDDEVARRRDRPDAVNARAAAPAAVSLELAGDERLVAVRRFAPACYELRHGLWSSEPAFAPFGRTPARLPARFTLDTAAAEPGAGIGALRARGEGEHRRDSSGEGRWEPVGSSSIVLTWSEGSAAVRMSLVAEEAGGTLRGEALSLEDGAPVRRTTVVARRIACTGPR